MRRICPIKNRDAALIPCLCHDVATGNWNQSSVVRDAILGGLLRDWQFVVALESHHAIFERKDRVGTPVRIIRRTASRLSSTAPFVAEENFCPGVVECR